MQCMHFTVQHFFQLMLLMFTFVSRVSREHVRKHARQLNTASCVCNSLTAHNAHQMVSPTQPHCKNKRRHWSAYCRPATLRVQIVVEATNRINITFHFNSQGEHLNRQVHQQVYYYTKGFWCYFITDAGYVVSIVVIMVVSGSHRWW